MYAPVVHARSTIIASKVGARVATEAVLSLQGSVRSRAHVRVTNEHTETLQFMLVSLAYVLTLN